MLEIKQHFMHHEKRIFCFLTIICVLFFLAIFFKNAWVSDDAYISFRSLEQIMAGNGARWNFDERVQVYTSPLWFGLSLIIRVFSENVFLASIFLSTTCCVAALLVARKLTSSIPSWCLLTLMLVGSRAVMDFSSSGLENSLLYLLMAVFLFFYINFFREEGSSKYFKSLCYVLGLLAITRHDVATLVFFPFVYCLFIFYRNEGFRKTIQPLLIASVPFLIWTIFSVVYYGMPFPNTAYAKMLHNIPRAELMEFGWLYVQKSFRYDIFALLIVSGFTFRVFYLRSLPLIFLWLGLCLNLFYVVFVGGDFMLGRFVSVAVFTSALSLFSSFTDEKKEKSIWFFPVVFSILIVLMGWANTPLKVPADSGFDLEEKQMHFSWRGILDERNFYFKTNSLWAYWHRDKNKNFPNHKWCFRGETAAKETDIIQFKGIGMYGYCAGVKLIVIDDLALSDPFLARLPKPSEIKWRAGHFSRTLPIGYFESRKTGMNHFEEPHLAVLWDDIVLVSRASLFSKERWIAIWRLNTGFHSDIAPYYLSQINLPKTQLSK